MKAKVLVVEDEEDLRSIVEYNLRLAGFETVAAGSAWAALKAVSEHRPDLVILDLMLPDFPGTQVCRELKEGEATKAIPVLMLTAKGEERDRVTGLEIGADDYVVKPVSMRELVLRVQALLRRRVPHPAATPAASLERTPGRAKDELVAGPFRMDLAAHLAYADGLPVDLTALEFRLLQTLIERAGRVQTRESLLEQVWQVRGDLTTRTVDTHIKRLRAKLGSGAGHIETVRGIGYRFGRGE